jgi:acetolactate synthase-1/2/3 large subunit
MRVADAIFQRLAREVDTVFYLPGGMCGPLVDALGQSGINAVCCLHEQGCGYAAVGYAQHRGFGVCLVTSGPGATNAMTPCLAAWLDSVPVLFISGQSPSGQLALPNMRSRGTQEGPTIHMVKYMVKTAYQAMNANNLGNILDDMIATAKNGRPGPVWLDIPLDVQGASIE